MKVVATEPAVPAPGLPRAQRLSLGVRGRSGVLSRLIRHEPVVLGAVLVVLVIVGTTLAAPWLPLANPNRPNFDQRLLPPLHGGFLLGTDQLGRDLLSRIIWGARVSLLVAVLAALIASTCGSLIGLAAGFLGGRVDGVIMRVIDIMLAFPYVLLAIGLVAALGPGLFNAMIAVAVVNISFYARNIRGSVVALRERGFVEAAQAAGAGTPRILARHILPNVIPALLVLISMNVGGAFLPGVGCAASAGGLGVDAWRRASVHDGCLSCDRDSRRGHPGPRLVVKRDRRRTAGRPRSSIAWSLREPAAVSVQNLQSASRLRGCIHVGGSRKARARDWS